MSTILSVALTIVKLIFALSIITVVHEFGHFLMAKLLGIKVNEFAVGFGPKLLQYKGKETVYSLRAILLGGYNAIEGEAEESNDPAAFNKQPAWKRLIILVMGSVFNIILAFGLFVFVSTNNDVPTTIIKSFTEYEFSEGSPVKRAGLLPGDEIVKINGVKIKDYKDIEQKYSNFNELDIEYKRDNKIYKSKLTNLKNKIGNIGMMIQQDLETGKNVIKFVEPGKPAVKTGLKSGDSIVKVNGVSVKTTDEVVNEIYKYPNEEIKIEFERNGEIIVGKSVKADTVERFNIGFYPEYRTPKGFEVLTYGTEYAIDTFAQVFDSYKNLFTGKVKVTQLSGIVGVGEVASKTESIIELLNLVAVVSLSVGLMNLLPIPPMDGGKMFITFGEIIFRKKMTIETETKISYIFLGLLIVLTIFVTINDIIRIF